MTRATLNRFEWLKLVMQTEGLSPTAKNVATALAVQFANDETGQLNPSQRTLADYLKVHVDTVKRVLRELRNAGWLLSLGDGGRGRAPVLRLLTPGKIVVLNPAGKGGEIPRASLKKGGRITPGGRGKSPPRI